MKRTTVEYICDRDGFTTSDRKKVPTRQIGDRRIDLCNRCFKALTDLVDQFMIQGQVSNGHAPQVPMPSFSAPLPDVNGSNPDVHPAAEPTVAEIRAWATENGYGVKPRGRFLPKEVTDAYREAHELDSPR